MFLLLLALFFLSHGTSNAATAPTRDLAMGGNVTATSDPATAPFTQPALLGGTPRLESSFSQARLDEETFLFQTDTVFPVLKGFGLGLSWDEEVARDQVQTETVRDSNGQVVVDPTTGQPLQRLLGFFARNDNDWSLAAGATRGPFSLGGSVHYLFTQFGPLRGSGWGADAGAHWAGGDWFRASWVVRDLGDTRLRFPRSEWTVTREAAWAGSLAILHKVGDLSFGLEPGANRAWRREGRTDWTGGLEAGYHQALFLRYGINRDRNSFGMGLVAKPPKVFKEVRIDFAYLARTGTPYPSRLTLTVVW